MSQALQFHAELPPIERKHSAASILRSRLSRLSAKPGFWAKIKTYKNVDSVNTAASLLRAGKLKCVPPGRFEFACRGKDLWARYVGPGKGNWGGGRKHRNGRG